MPTIDEIFTSVKDGKGFPKTEVRVCLRLDLVHEKKELIDAQVKKRMKDESVSEVHDSRLGKKVGDEPERTPEEEEFRAKVEAINDEMVDYTLTFHMQGISTKEYNIIQARSGRPRNGNPADQAVGFNTQIFYQNLMARCTYKVTTSTGDEREFGAPDWESLFESIIDEQFDDLVNGCYSINREAAGRNPTRARS